MSNAAIDEPKTIDNERVGYKIAKANQECFEEKFENVMTDRQYNIGNCDDNVVLVGGCALNVVNNQKIKDRGFNTYVPPNPSDSGISLGALFWYLHLVGIDIPKQDWKFSGIPLIENKKFRKKRKTPIKKLASMIQDGAILGIVEGNMEVGPRALGHRSIICDPSIKGIKDKLNADVKHREFYRPFAPIVLEEHARDWFDMPGGVINSPYMSFVCKCLKPDEIPAVVHADGTSRVQTVNRNQHPELYHAMRQWHAETGCPVVLNTSLNIKGQPIVNTEAEAEEFAKHYKVKVHCRDDY
jgi:carbamoyltransferase